MAVLQDMIAKEVLSQVTVINVYPAMSGRLAADSKEHYNMYFVHDEHFNEYGYRLFGEVVAQAIAPYLKENANSITGSAGTESR
jgi:hypothetical protein